MGLWSDIQADIGQAFDSDLSDAVQVINYHEVTSVVDPVTNGVVETRNTLVSRAVISPFTSQEVGASQGAILSKDIKVLFLDSELAYTRPPQINDYVDNKRVLAVSTDPANCQYSLQTRETGN